MSYSRTKSDTSDTQRTAELTPLLKASTAKAIHKTLKMLPTENAMISLKLQLKSLEDDILNAINDLRQEKKIVGGKLAQRIGMAQCPHF